MDQLDPQVVNLAKSIRQIESGGNFAARSKDGSYGAYQFIKPTWDSTAKKYGVNAAWEQATPAQQNEVAYKQLKEWKDKGYNVGQIASMWNAGAGRPDAYKEGLKGTNKDGVNYNVAEYAKKVATEYQKIKGGQSPIVQQPVQTVTEQREDLKDQGEPVSVNPNKVEPTTGGKVLRGLLTPLARLATNFDVLHPNKTSYKSGYLGEINPIGYKAVDINNRQSQGENVSNKEIVGAAANTFKEGLGNAAELASYGVGGGGVGKVAQATLKGKILAGVGQGLKAGSIGGGLAGGGQALQQDKTAAEVLKDTATGAAIGGATGGVLGGAVPGAVNLAKGVRELFPQTVRENVARVLKNTGTKKLSQIGSRKELDDAVEGFNSIRENAPNIRVKDINDFEKVFEPSNATFFELPQALKQTKDAIYKQYTDIAKTSGDQGVVFGPKEFKSLENILSKYEGKGYTPAFSTKAKQFKEALQRYGALNPKTGGIEYGAVSPLELQDLIEKINLDVNPLSDKAGTQVANEFSSELRKLLDDKLEKSGNPSYQAIRNKYAQLKSIEKDVILRYKEALRKANANPNLIDGIASLDAIMGVINMEPTQVVRAGVIAALKKAFGHLRDPEVNLQKAFKALENQSVKSRPVNQATQSTISTTNKNDIPKTLPKIKDIVKKKK